MRSRTTRVLVLNLLALGMLAPLGCTFNRTGPKRPGESILGTIGNAAGQVIEPKRCQLTVVMLTRPVNDSVVNDSIWSTADEQGLSSETRHALENNGLRIGVLTGGVPAEVEAVVNAPPPNKVEPAEFNIPDGSNTLVSLAEAVPSASLILNRDGRALGKDFKDASGWFRITARHEGATGVSLRFVPEIHHGAVSRRFDAMPSNTGNFNAMPYVVKDGQQEDTLRELAATLTLEPGQVAVIGCRPERKASLGTFLFTHAEANSDRLLQRVVLVRSSRSNLGIPGSQPTPGSGLEPIEPPDLPDSAASAARLDPARSVDTGNRTRDPEVTRASTSSWRDRLRGAAVRAN